MKTSNSVLSAVVVSVLGLSATLSAPQALAIDGKNYTGFACHKWSGDGVPSSAWSSVYNASSTGSLFLDCPVVKDVIDSNISAGWVRATDRHPTLDISCALFSVSRDTSNSALIFSASPNTFTEGSSERVQTLNFGPQQGFSLGHYFYACAIPPVSNGKISEIHTLQVTENGSGG